MIEQPFIQKIVWPSHDAVHEFVIRDISCVEPFRLCLRALTVTLSRVPFSGSLHKPQTSSEGYATLLLVMSETP